MAKKKQIRKISKYLCLVIFTMAPFALVSGQDKPRRQVDSLIKVLQHNKIDSERFEIILRIAKFHIFKPGEQKADLDSAAVFISQAQQMRLRNLSLRSKGFMNLILGYYYNESGKKSESEAALDKAIYYLSRSTAQSLLGETYLEKEYHIPLTVASLSRKIELAKLALTAFTADGNKLRQADCLTQLADLRTVFDDKNDEALVEVNTALKIRNNLRAPDLQTYIILSRIYTQRTSFKKALSATLDGLKLAEREHFSQAELCGMYYTAGVLYYKLQEYTNAVSYWQLALPFLEATNDDDIYSVVFNICSAYAFLSKNNQALTLIQKIESRHKRKNEEMNFLMALARLSIYTDQKKFELARSYYDQVRLDQITYIKSVNRRQILVYRQMIKFLIATKQFGEANRLLRSNDISLIGAYDPEAVAIQYRQWYQLDTMKRDYRAASAHLLRFKQLNDSIARENETRALKEIQIQYETDQKDNDLKLQRQHIVVLNQQQKLQASQLQRADLLRNITILGIICLLVFAALLYRQLRDRQIANKLILAKNDQLEHLLHENEWLLKEVHHRVKNNLQLITGLLNSQSVYLKDGAALNAIMESQRRVQSMALIHQKLYKASNYSSIYMPEYIRDLVEYLESSFSSEKTVYFKMDICAIHLDIANAIPLGLIINESVTNSIKYAFTEGDEKRIEISLCLAADEVHLRIADNGKGLPLDFGQRQQSFGLMLMKGLSEEMNGKFEITSGVDGTLVQVAFIPAEIELKARLIPA